MTEQEVIAHKNDIIPTIKRQLKKDGLMDLTGWVDTHSPYSECKHPGFVRSVAYRMEKIGIVEVIPLEDWKRFYIKELAWYKKYPYWQSVLVGLTGTIIGCVIGVLLKHYKLL